MNCLGLHVCGDEIFAAMMVVPFIGIYGRRLSVWWHARKTKVCECPSLHGKKKSDD